MKRREWLEGGRFVDVEGRRIWTRVDGDGPTLLFVHGFPTSSHDWEPVVARLRDRFRCVVMDLLGFGASDKPLVRYSLSMQLRVVESVAAQLGVTDHVLVAHDYGVSVAQLVLSKRRGSPLHPRGVVLMNGGLNPALHRARLVQRFLASRVGAVVGPYVVRRAAFERSMRSVITRTESLDWDDLWESTSSNGGTRVAPLLLRYIAERRELADELTGALRNTQTPLEFVWGMDDPVSGAHVVPWIRETVPSARIHTLEGVGHYPQLEAPDEVAAIVSAASARWYTEA